MDTIVSGERPTPREGTVRIELWVPSGRRAEFTPVIDRLDDAVERGLIEEYTVETWDRFVDLSGSLSPRERRVRDRLASYAQWAATHGERLTGLGDLVDERDDHVRTRSNPVVFRRDGRRCEFHGRRSAPRRFGFAKGFILATWYCRVSGFSLPLPAVEIQPYSVHYALSAVGRDWHSYTWTGSRRRS